MDKIMKYINKSSTLEEVNAFINEASLTKLDNTDDELFDKYLRKLDKKARSKLIKKTKKNINKIIAEMIGIVEDIDDKEVL